MFATESIQSKVKFHMNALERHVNNEKHYHFMVYHFLALKIQLERFGNSTEEMEGKVFVGDFTDKASYKQERKRPEEHKNRVKALRSSKAESLKYVLQWENLTNNQKGENIFKNVPMRAKFDNIPLAGIPEDDNLTEDVSKIMVTKRVQLFEGYRKPKRASSTMEAFLENTFEKTKITSVLEMLEEEDQDVRNSRKLSDGLINYKEIFDQNLLQTTDEKKSIQNVTFVVEKLNLEQDVKNSKLTLFNIADQEKNVLEMNSAVEKEEIQENISSSKIEEDTTINSNRSVTNQLAQIFPENENETNKVKEFPFHIEMENCSPNESVCTKPRIVQVHYKQNISKSFLP